MDKEKALEFARCAEINLKNLSKIYSPFLGTHPMFQIVDTQIREIIKELEKE